MYSRSELAQFAKVCTSIGNDIADEAGFVPIRNLLSRFHAKLLIRPLLVEGMLASVEESGQGDSSTSQWAVLLDSETYQVSKSDLELEDSNKPLSSRLRNTVAHELVHSLAFRPSEFGIRLENSKGHKRGRSALVEEIEKQTEKFSPLLLWPENSLAKFLSTKMQTITIEELTQVFKTMGISRYVLINRLSLLPLTDDNRNHEGLRNIGIGIGEWCSENRAVLRSWPLFLNFERHVIPSFLLTLRKQDRLPAETIFLDQAFGMCGGANNYIELETKAKTIDSDNLKTMHVQCSIEKTKRKIGSSFLFAVRKLREA